MTSGFTNGIVQTKGEVLLRVGTAVIGDIGAGSGSQTVTGYFTSATKSTPGGSVSILSIVYPDLGFVPKVMVSINSNGTPGLDNDIAPPIVDSLTSTGFEVYMEETVSVIQNITLMCVLFQEFA